MAVTQSAKALFQSTLPRGERHGNADDFQRLISISIHAPARGATVSVGALSTSPRNFNPRSREGSDSVLRPRSGKSDYFNPRSREGSDVCTMVAEASSARFQSTLPRGERRGAYRLKFFGFEISIHAPARGATRAIRKTDKQPQISIHAPARGATFERGEAGMSYQDFNPRSREGSDPWA